MKMIRFNCVFFILIGLLVPIVSCEREKVPNMDDFGETTVKNVQLEGYTETSITISWDFISEAASYTVQLLESLDDDKPVDQYTTTTRNLHTFDGLNEVTGYYVRVRANFHTPENPVLGDWVYIKDGSEPGRIMPKYGFVDENFEEPEPDPTVDPQLYPGFPEGFENHDDDVGPRKNSYTGTGPTGENTDYFATGEWVLERVYTLSTAALIHKIGTWCAMMSPNIEAYVAMNFDLPYGARKFSYITGVATLTNQNDINGMPITIKTEYSIDGGNSWIQIGDDLLIDDMEKQYFVEFNDLEIMDPVRFRITKSASLARPILDDIAVYY